MRARDSPCACVRCSNAHTHTPTSAIKKKKKKKKKETRGARDSRLEPNEADDRHTWGSRGAEERHVECSMVGNYCEPKGENIKPNESALRSSNEERPFGLVPLRVRSTTSIQIGSKRRMYNNNTLSTYPSAAAGRIL